MSTLSDIECRVLDNRLHAGVIPLVTPLSGLDYFDLYDWMTFTPISEDEIQIEGLGEVQLEQYLCRPINQILLKNL